MLIWTILTVVTALVAVALAIPLVRRYDAPAAERGAVIAVLRDQLTDLDAQAAAGTLPAAEASALKAEVQRRLLAEARAPEAAARPFTARGRAGMAFAAAGLVALAATGLYAYLGRPDLAGRAVAPPAQVATAAPAGPPGVDAMIGQLEARLTQSPDDATGWSMLGISYFQLGRYADAARAYERAVALRPDGEGYASALGEARVAAANGAVTPAAVESFRRAVAIDAKDARARYFLALSRDQAGDRKAALDEWIRLYREAPPGAPYATELRKVIEQAGAASGIEVASRIGAVPAGVPAPSTEAAAAVAALPAGDQQAMIRSMVDGLAQRLAADPGDAAGWERLMRARMVLGEPEAAARALKDGETAFAGDAAARARLRATASALGVPGT